jgi:small subunit ribosomal protein S20
MPIIKSAKKRMRQNKVHRARNFMLRSTLKTHIKKVMESVKAGEKEAAQKDLQVAYSIIDTAAKKNIIHENNAARKKSRLTKMFNQMSK